MKTITRGLEEEKQLRSQIYHALHGEIVDPVRRQVEESKHGSYFRSRMEGNSLRVEKGLMKSLYALFEDVRAETSNIPPCVYSVSYLSHRMGLPVRLFGIFAGAKGFPGK